MSLIIMFPMNTEVHGRMQKESSKNISAAKNISEFSLQPIIFFIESMFPHHLQ